MTHYLIVGLIVILGSSMLRAYAANKRAAAAERREAGYREICDKQDEAMKRQSEGIDALVKASENLRGSLATVEAQRDEFLQLLQQR